MYKFDIDEKVRIKTNGKVGIIKSYRHERFKQKETVMEQKRYLINTGGYSNEWHDEFELEYEYTFTPKFELNLINLMIDVNLGENDFHNVIMWHDKKKSNG